MWEESRRSPARWLSAYLYDAVRIKTVLPSSNTFYSYDRDNHMTRFKDTVTLDFKYDGDGARREKTQGASVTKFIYDRKTGTPGLDPVLLETDAFDVTQVRYTHGLELVSQKVTSSSTPHYYHFEAIGTTRQLTDNGQLVTDNYTFDAWGNAVTQVGTTSNPFRYVGKENYYVDTQSNLMLLGVRYYDPAKGRFTTKDPIQSGRNWYGYVQNPIRYSDPSGLRCCPVRI